MPTQSGQDVAGKVLVVDGRELRRAAVAGLIRPWAEDHELEVQELSPDAVLETIESGGEIRLLVLSIGGSSVSNQDVQRLVKIIRALASDLPIVVVSDLDEVSEVTGALGMGVSGFLPTVTSNELATRALTFILAGGSYFPPATIRQLPNPVPQAAQSGSSSSDSGGGRPSKPPARGAAREQDDGDASSAPMTSRQKEVLDHLCRGEPNKIIARKLGMTEATVKVHVRQILRKLGAANRTQAALSAALARGEAEELYPSEGARMPIFLPTG